MSLSHDTRVGQEWRAVKRDGHRYVFLTIDDTGVYHVSGHTQSGKRFSFETDDPLLLIQGIRGRLPRKPCTVCLLQKALTAYARDDESADNRAAICLECDRAKAKGKRKASSCPLPAPPDD